MNPFKKLSLLAAALLPKLEIDQATGISITFGTTGFTALIKGAVEASTSRGSVDTTHSETTPDANNYVWRTFQPSDLINANEVSLLLHFDVDEEIPINEDAETITITFPIPHGSAETTNATIEFTGFITERSFTANPLDDNTMEANVTIKRSGKPTYTAGSA